MCVACEGPGEGSDEDTNTPDGNTSEKTDENTDRPAGSGVIGDIPLDRDHYLALSFVDAEGKDLLMGITSAGSLNPSNYSMDPALYTLTSSPDLYDLGLYNNPDAIYDDIHRYPRAVLHDLESVGFRHWGMAIRMTVPTIWYTKEHPDLKEITYTLTCPHVFGDEAEHEIVTYWRKPTGWDESWPGGGHFRVCHRVVVDGEECTDISYTDGEGASFATITLDR